MWPLLSGAGGSKKRTISESTRDVTKRVVLELSSGPSSAPPKGYGGGSARSKAARILMNASGDILPHMKRSFAER
jgi:hypothetical protein